MDADGDGYVDFQELCNGLGQLTENEALFALECYEMFDGIATQRHLDYSQFSRFIRRYSKKIVFCFFVFCFLSSTVLFFRYEAQM